MGENGAGKSSVIQSLLLVRQSLQSGDIRAGRIGLNGELCNIGTGVDLLRQGADEEQIDISLTSTSGSKATYSLAYESTADSLRLATGYVSLPELERDGFIYLTAERAGPRLTSPRSITKATKKDLGVNGEGALAALEHYRAHILEAADPRRRGRAGSLEELFQSYLAEISPNVRIDLRPYSDVDSIGSSFNFTMPGGLPGLPFRPTNVGFGLSYSLSIIVACLVSEPGSILIVENPEAHLHTRSQRAVCELLTRTAMAGTQVIAETHSREIYHWLRNQAALANIPPEIGCINYIEATQLEHQRVSRCSSLRSLTDDLGNWPQNFFDAYGSPTDLLRPI
jgi:predicted ATPase